MCTQNFRHGGTKNKKSLESQDCEVTLICYAFLKDTTIGNIYPKYDFSVYNICRGKIFFCHGLPELLFSKLWKNCKILLIIQDKDLDCSKLFKILLSNKNACKYGVSYCHNWTFFIIQWKVLIWVKTWFFLAKCKIIEKILLFSIQIYDTTYLTQIVWLLTGFW